MARQCALLLSPSSAKLLRDDFDDVCENAHMTDTPMTLTVRERQQAWINKIREDSGDSYAAIARRAGVAASTVVRFMNSKSASHSLSAETEAKISAAYCSEPAKGLDIITVEGMARVPIVGAVQAGNWQSGFMEHEYHAAEFIIAPPDPRYPLIPRVAFRVRGDSMDRLYPPGTIILAVRFYDLARPPKTGEKVIVIRQSEGFEEATVKEIELLEDGRVALWPRSTNPEHSAAIIAPSLQDIFADDGGHPDVRVEALVIQSIRLE